MILIRSLDSNTNPADLSIRQSYRRRESESYRHLDIRMIASPEIFPFSFLVHNISHDCSFLTRFTVSPSYLEQRVIFSVLV